MGFFKRKEKAGKTSGGQEIPERNKPWIDQETGIGYCADSREMYLEILQDYCSESEKSRKKLQECMEKEDWKNFEVYVHSVKSSSKTIGAVDFSGEALELEMAAKEGKIRTVRDGWQKFNGHFEQVIEEAGKILEHA